ncbi:hypothetical protein PV04_00759 [Phialophora macrospora]|uniref:Uncharacterized protein n=1 Tax=Phialophora macrospora TaxID=1851006 RepID=A0A0D2EE60_9EURO|nr:hypothetical protein PV04_00759 [Phialophora macrospora]
MLRSLSPASDSWPHIVLSLPTVFLFHTCYCHQLRLIHNLYPSSSENIGANQSRPTHDAKHKLKSKPSLGESQLDPEANKELRRLRELVVRDLRPLERITEKNAVSLHKKLGRSSRRRGSDS